MRTVIVSLSSANASVPSDVLVSSVLSTRIFPYFCSPLINEASTMPSSFLANERSAYFTPIEITPASSFAFNPESESVVSQINSGAGHF